jgi:hypothetical protein
MQSAERGSDAKPGRCGLQDRETDDSYRATPMLAVSPTPAEAWQPNEAPANSDKARHAKINFFIVEISCVCCLCVKLRGIAFSGYRVTPTCVEPCGSTSALAWQPTIMVENSASRAVTTNTCLMVESPCPTISGHKR